MDLRNIAIIAHVDHGKTTLVDGLLRQSGTVRANQPMQERAMDSGELERERGITILAKCTAIDWHGVRINIVDTPGHADFGGEVERVLGMVDGVLVLVDAAEGPMPQTKFVVDKALRLGLRPIVAISKMDRADARPKTVHEAVFDLFDALGATNEQLDFPLVYTSARDGWASHDPAAAGTDMTPLFESVIAHVPAPATDRDASFRMSISLLEADPFLGRLVSGRVLSGQVEANQTVTVLGPDGAVVEVTRLTKLLRARGLERIPVERAGAGEIVTLAGLKTASVADTVAASGSCAPIPAEPIDPPTIAMVFSINELTARGTRGNAAHLAHDRGTPRSRSRGQCRDPGERHGGGRRLRGGRPRRTSTRSADRDDAPRGLRALDRPPAGADARRPGGWRTARAHRGNPDRCGRSLRRRRGECARGATRRADRAAALRAGQESARCFTARRAA